MRARSPLLRPLGWATVCVAASACAELRYQPEEVVLPPDPAAFAALADAIRVEFPRFQEFDPRAQRLQSEWSEYDGGAVPGRRRVTVFPVAPGRVGIAVERIWLRTTLAGDPYWSRPESDRGSERQLGDAVRGRLEAGLSPRPGS
ncbi:MAG: hypothetical protein R3F56_26085 [Planctomycetota bacterium]